MDFKYSKKNLSRKDQRWQRGFEILPGLISWSMLLGLTACSVIKPVLAAVIAIAFLFYWFLRLIYMTIFLLLSFFLLSLEEKTDWLSRIKDIDALQYVPRSNPGPAHTFRQHLSLRSHIKALAALKKSGSRPPLSGDIVHLVILPVAKESANVIRPGVIALTRQSFSSKKIMVVFAVEETAPEQTKDALAGIRQDFRHAFRDFQIIIHPRGLPGETAVKGANATYAARKTAAYFRERGVPFANVIVSCFDADTVVCENYFACLTYYFLLTPDRNRASYQPIPVYHNNIWTVPGISRVMESGASFFQLIEATNPQQLVTFSSHSMSFKTLTEIDFWPTDMISDDSAIFWKAFLRYDGNYHTVPMPITLSMDATAAGTWWQTAKNIYKQKRRWAYGVENFPLLMRGLMAARQIPFWKKTSHAYKMLEGHISWATWGLLLTTLDWLPAHLASKEFHRSVVYYNEPNITGTIFRLSTFSLIISIVLSIAMLPKPAIRHSWRIRIGHALEWLAFPFVLLFLSTIPALHAQTTLMFGKHMGFWVTDKTRKSSP